MNAIEAELNNNTSNIDGCGCDPLVLVRNYYVRTCSFRIISPSILSTCPTRCILRVTPAVYCIDSYTVTYVSHTHKYTTLSSTE
jgi:hypothetical protein